MAQFGYTDIREMDARPGVKYRTRYYKQESQERRRLREHCNSIYSGFNHRCELNPELMDYAKSSIGGRHRRRDGSPYTVIQVLEDAVNQMNAGKDMPESMINRWNRALAGTGLEIEMVLQSALPATADSWSLFDAS